MKKLAFAASALAAMFAASIAAAESFEDICLRVSDEWGTAGDVAGQCSCLADFAAADAALESELKGLADSQSSDDAAYEAGSDEAKAAFDSCSVNS